MTWIWNSPEASGEHPSWLGSSGEIGSETPWGAGAAKAEATRPRKMAYFIVMSMYKIDGRLFNSQYKDFCRAKVGRLLSERTGPAMYGIFKKCHLLGGGRGHVR